MGHLPRFATNFSRPFRNILIGSQLHSGPQARLYTSLGPSPQVPGPKNNQGLKARSNASVAASAPAGRPRSAGQTCRQSKPVAPMSFGRFADLAMGDPGAVSGCAPARPGQVSVRRKRRRPATSSAGTAEIHSHKYRSPYSMRCFFSQTGNISIS